MRMTSTLELDRNRPRGCRFERGDDLSALIEIQAADTFCRYNCCELKRVGNRDSYRCDLGLFGDFTDRPADLIAHTGMNL